MSDRARLLLSATVALLVSSVVIAVGPARGATTFGNVWNVQVECGRTGDAEGWYDFVGIRISNRTCQALVHPELHPYYDIAEAVFILGHEEGHAHDPRLGLGDIPYERTCGRPGPCEGFADCYAAGHVYALARALGFTGEQARRYRGWVHKYRHVGGYAAIPQRCFA